MSTHKRTGSKGPEVSARLRRAGPMRDRRARRAEMIRACAECGAPALKPNVLCPSCYDEAIAEVPTSRFIWDGSEIELLTNSGECR